MTRRLFPLSVVLLALTLIQVPAQTLALDASTAHPISAWNFDWDDNVLNMPTKIMVWDKVKKAEIPVSTSQWVFVKSEIGNSGEWKNRELRMKIADPKKRSLRYFGDELGPQNLFLRDALKAMEAPPAKWQGPSWNAFVTVLSDAEAAKRATIITARMHEPETIYAGLKELRKRGWIRNLPPLGNIYPVANLKLAKKLGGSVEAPASAKARVMEKLLAELNATPIAPNCPEVINREGNGREKMQLWAFSDDDYGNISTAVETLSQEVQKYPHVKIALYFTGLNNPLQRPHAIVLTPDGGTRPLSPEEQGESGLGRPYAQLLSGAASCIDNADSAGHCVAQ